MYQLRKISLAIKHCAAVVAAISPAIYAQSPSDGGDRVMLEEVIVTAQKRADSAQLTAVSLTAASGEALREAGIRAPQDLSGISPSLTSTMSNGQLQVSVRGIGNEIITTGVGESGIAIHTNGVYMGSNLTPSLGFFDVERVEVLRGPQGTLWGRNATGGAINIIQKKPSSEFEAYVDLGYSSFQTQNVEAAVSGSIADTVSGRIAILHNEGDGYLENLAENGKDLGDNGTDAVRASVNIELGETGNWLLAAGYGNRDIYGQAIRQEGTPFQEGVANPFSGTPGELSFAEHAFGETAPRGKFKTYSTSPRVHDELELSYFTSEFDVDFDGFGLTLLTDYRKHNSSALRDVDYTATSVQESTAYYVEEAEEFSQEIRFSSNNNSEIEWVAGGYFYRQSLSSDIMVDAGPYPGVPDVMFGGAFGPDYVAGGVNSGGELKVESVALFGQGTWQFQDDWGLTVGLRYGQDSKEAVEYNEVRLGSSTGPILQRGDGSVDGDWSDWSGKIGLEYSLTHDVFVFANIAKGYKSGGINLGSLTGEFEPEELISYEAGVKSTLLDHRLRLNVTAFYSDFSDYQFQSVEGVNTVITNGDAEIYGLEVEVDFIPSDNWLIKLVGSYNHSEITQFNATDLRNPATGVPVQAGGALPRTPETAYRTSIRRFFTFDNGAEVSVDATYTWQDDVNLDSFETHNGSQEAYGLLDLSAQWVDETDTWTVNVYGKNLNNEFYKTSAFFNSSALGGAAQAQVGMPRNYGVRIRRNF